MSGVALRIMAPLALTKETLPAQEAAVPLVALAAIFKTSTSAVSLEAGLEYRTNPGAGPAARFGSATPDDLAAVSTGPASGFHPAAAPGPAIGERAAG